MWPLLSWVIWFLSYNYSDLSNQDEGFGAHYTINVIRNPRNSICFFLLGPYSEAKSARCPLRGGVSSSGAGAAGLRHFAAAMASGVFPPLYLETHRRTRGLWV